jgi:hypothetical protein
MAAPLNSKDEPPAYLTCQGRDRPDAYTLTPADATGQTVAVSINGVMQPGGPFGSIAHILVYGQTGNDTIQEQTALFNKKPVSIGVPALLFAGSGNTILSATGSSANNVLVGGSGNDTLIGGTGQDILIAGSGMSVLHSGSGAGDLLIPGSTTYTPSVGGVSLPNVPALLALSAEWGRTDLSYLARVQDLFAGGSGSRNGSSLLNSSSVLLSRAVDQLFANGPADWLWFADNAKVVDTINNLPSGSILTFE